MAQRMWKYTGGFDAALDFCETVEIDDDAALADGQKDLFVRVSASAASKVLTLGLDDGQFMVIANVGASNAISLKNIAADTGTSLAAGKVALVIGGSSTADSVKVYVLN